MKLKKKRRKEKETRIRNWNVAEENVRWGTGPPGKL